MKKRAATGNIDTVFVLVIFSTFAFSVLMVLALGAGIYRNISDITRESENERTALSYVRTKVRNLDRAGAFSVAPLGGNSEGSAITALRISENLGGTEYVTLIYEYDGWLREMVCEADLTFAPDDGMRVAPIDSLLFEKHDDGSIVVFAGDMRMLLYPRSGGFHVGSQEIAGQARNDESGGGE